jgi:hypothetical protein
MTGGKDEPERAMKMSLSEEDRKDNVGSVEIWRVSNSEFSRKSKKWH